MADTDITLTVGLDPRQARTQLNDMRRELQRMQEDLNRSTGNAGNNRPDITPRVDNAALDAANARIQELTNRLNELQSTLDSFTGGAAQSTWEYINSLMYAPEAQPAFDHIVELMNEANDLSDQLAQNPALEGAEERMHAIGTEISTIVQTLMQSGQAWERPSQEVQQLTAQVAQLEAQLRNVNRQEQQTAGQDVGGILAGFIGGGPGGGATQIVNTLSKSVNKIFRSVKRIAVTMVGIVLGVRGIQSIINKLRSAIKEGFKAIYEGDKKFKKQVDDLKKSWAEVKANLAAAFMPIVQIAIPYIQQLLNWINLLIDKIAMFVAAIAGQNAYTKAIKATGDAAKGASKQLSKFDELNNLTTSGGSDWSTQQVPVDAKMVELAERLKAILKEIKDFFSENVFGPFKEGFLEAIGDWQGKLNELKENLKGIGINLKDIFSDSQLQQSMKTYIQSLSKLFGSITGLFANYGLNAAMAYTAGFRKFLEDNKDNIKERLSDIFSVATDDIDKTNEFVVALSRIVDVFGESEAVAGNLANIFGILWEVMSGVELIALKVYGVFADLLFPMITQNVEPIKQAIDGVAQVMERVTGLIKIIIADLITHITDFIDGVVQPVFAFLGQVFSQIVAWLLKLWMTAQPFFLWLMDNITEIYTEYIDPIVDDIIATVSEMVAIILPILQDLWQNIIVPLCNYLIDTVVPILVPIFQVAFNAVFTGIKLALSLIGTLFSTLKLVVQGIGALLRGDFTSFIKYGAAAFITLFFKPIKDTIKLIEEHFEKLKTSAGQIIQGLVTIIVGAVNTIRTMVENVANTMVDFLTGMQFDIPDWVPGVGGKHFGGFGLQRISFESIPVPTIPGLAKGTVIPPSMSDFIARLGDNNSETEVVSPLSTIKEALMEALQESGGTGEIHIHVDLDGREIAKSMVRQNEVFKKSTGRTLFA